ncbi:DUF4363 family protein [Clostridium tyrobutyricum]|uniref:DUF4363 domain-containing protein n=1 Tax=Clostridium tyrobutyricum DIVETGP TaxID=1408889 RepID=W6N7G2_CLOTY|nr:DUF4363 family protein [Clostridium tyrobutyricum]AND83460.1 hypothetical protein CTK_C01900 [Clostridium tyrobutyricum]ANP68258.1 hypothetical protein BA182_00785 [Clostridium tyrobutyricum]MBV4433229.1 DUF4363 family protein [Clostridium tyrobutyricum]QNB67397.1 DUF4363 family protein [Clostridium tyrobutyricum]CDL91274.1 hypothetical protein CTDIVETGP_1344 [Clostridium tyrobutyricum DIVETGP]
MKSSITSISIFIIMVLFIVFSVHYLKIIDSKLIYSSNQIEKSLDSNSFDKADDFLKQFKINWNKYSNKMTLFTNNNEIDDINLELSELSQHIRFKNKEEALVSINSIRNIINSISDMERLSLQNIF